MADPTMRAHSRSIEDVKRDIRDTRGRLEETMARTIHRLDAYASDRPLDAAAAHKDDGAVGMIVNVLQTWHSLRSKWARAKRTGRARRAAMIAVATGIGFLVARTSHRRLSQRLPMRSTNGVQE